MATYKVIIRTCLYTH